jgi:hypothetical protein
MRPDCSTNACSPHIACDAIGPSGGNFCLPEWQFPRPFAAIVVVVVIALGTYALRSRRPVVYIQQQPSLVTVLSESGLEIVPAPQLRVQR